MSLNAHDKQALAQIEEELQGTDPRFAARLSAFCHWADGEEMPEREEIRGARRARRLMYAIAVAMAVSITLAVISVALILGHAGTTGACSQSLAGACHRHTAPTAPAPVGHKAQAPPLFP